MAAAVDVWARASLIVILCLRLITARQCAAADASTSQARPPDDVLDLTDANFSDVVDAPRANVLVAFYAPWCGHSQRFAPQYSRAARRLERERRDDPTLAYTLARVDAVEEKRLAAKYGVQSYPKLIWFADGGRPMPFDGDLKTNDVVDWVLRRGGPLVKALADARALDAFRLSYTVAAVVGSPSEGALQTFEEVCRGVANVPIRCGRLDNATAAESGAGGALAAAMLPRAAGDVVVYRAVDDAAVHYPGAPPDDDGPGAAVARLRAFLMAQSLPPVVEYTPSTQAAVFASSVPLLVMLLEARESHPDEAPGRRTASEPRAGGAQQPAADDGSPADRRRRDFEAAAAALHGRAIFVRLDTQAHWHSVAAHFHVRGVAQLPALVMLDKEAGLRYVLPAWSGGAAGMEAAVRRVLAGEERPYTGTALPPPSGGPWPPSERVSNRARWTRQPAIPHHLSAPAAWAPLAGAMDDAAIAAAVATLDAGELAAGVHSLRAAGGPSPSTPHVLLLFHAAWCSGCATLRQSFAALAAADAPLADGSVLRMAAVHVDGSRQVATPRLRRLPSVFLLRASAAVDAARELDRAEPLLQGPLPEGQELATLAEDALGLAWRLPAGSRHAFRVDPPPFKMNGVLVPTPGSLGGEEPRG